MKRFATALALVFSTVALFSQGTVNFSNAGHPLTTNTPVPVPNNISPAGAYRIALYVDAPGSSYPLQFVASTTNGPIAGYFNGGNVAVLLPPGTDVSFQVRAWSAFAGASYESAFATAASNPSLPILLGQSALGYFTVPASGTINLFGNQPGQVTGFQLAPLIPEPSVYALATLALAAVVMRGRSRR